MTALWMLLSATLGVVVGHMLTASKAMTPAQFAAECAQIVETLHGHAAHQALDLLSNRLLNSLGYGEGVAIFERAVAGWHDETAPYPRKDEG